MFKIKNFLSISGSFWDNEQISSLLIYLYVILETLFLFWIQTVWSLKEKFTLLGEKKLIQSLQRIFTFFFKFSWLQPTAKDN